MEEVSIGKSVPNLVSYLHEFSHNFSQSLAICFELFSFREIVYSEIADERAPPVTRRAPLQRGRHVPHRCHGLKPLSGQRAACPDSRLARAARPRQPPLPRRPPPDRLARTAVTPTARLACAAVPTAAVRSRRCPGPSPYRAARRSPVAVTPHRRSPPSPVRRRRATVGSPSSAPPGSAAAARSHRAPRVARAGRVGPRQCHARGLRTQRQPRPWAAPALCIWAERGFGPVTPG
jgi:hypothetical protein